MYENSHTYEYQAVFFRSSTEMFLKVPKKKLSHFGQNV